MAVGVFGSLLERRFGWFAVLAIFLACRRRGGRCRRGGGPRAAFDDGPSTWCSARTAPRSGCWPPGTWTTAARRGGAQDRENDLLGVYVFAALLALLPLAVTEASFVAGFAGAATGALLGLVLPVFARR